MGKRAVTISVACLIPADDYDARLAEVIDGLERGLQQAGADYAAVQTRPGMAADQSDLVDGQVNSGYEQPQIPPELDLT
jgi:hypothetical protein